MASHENGKRERVGQEVITHLSYLMLLALKTAEYITELRGRCKDISDLLLLVETLFLFAFSPQSFTCQRPPWAYFLLMFAFTKLCEVKPAESSIIPVGKEKIVAR